MEGQKLLVKELSQLYLRSYILIKQALLKVDSLAKMFGFWNDIIEYVDAKKLPGIFLFIDFASSQQNNVSEAEVTGNDAHRLIWLFDRQIVRQSSEIFSCLRVHTLMQNSQGALQVHLGRALENVRL